MVFIGKYDRLPNQVRIVTRFDVLHHLEQRITVEFLAFLPSYVRNDASIKVTMSGSIPSFIFEQDRMIPTQAWTSDPELLKGICSVKDCISGKQSTERMTSESSIRGICPVMLVDIWNDFVLNNL